MKVLCDAQHVPAKVGDYAFMQLAAGGQVQVRLAALPDHPGNWPVITGFDLGSVRVDPEKLGLHWEDRPDPAPAELTVRDQYVLALIPLMRDSHPTSWEDRINKAFRLADYCMQKRK